MASNLSPYFSGCAVNKSIFCGKYTTLLIKEKPRKEKESQPLRGFKGDYNESRSSNFSLPDADSNYRVTSPMGTSVEIPISCLAERQRSELRSANGGGRPKGGFLGIYPNGHLGQVIRSFVSINTSMSTYMLEPSDHL